MLAAGSLVFWFHSFDALHEDRASVHIGKGCQDDVNDAKVWLEPEVSVAKTRRVLKRHELRTALKIVEDNRDFLWEHGMT